MSHRTQVTLPDAQYERLKDEATRTGMGLAELVRRALEAAYGGGSAADAGAVLDETFGAWRERDSDGEEYVENLRRGMAHRLSR